MKFNKLCGWILFRSLKNSKIEDRSELIPTLIHKTGMGHSFWSIFDNSRKTRAIGPSFFVTFTLRLFNSHNHAHEPGQYVWPSPGPGPYSNLSPSAQESRTVEVWGSCSELKQCQRVIGTDEIQDKNYWRECSNIKCVCQCTDGLSATQMAKEQQKVSASCWIRTHIFIFTATGLTHWAASSCPSTEKTVYD